MKRFIIFILFAFITMTSLSQTDSEHQSEYTQKQEKKTEALDKYNNVVYEIYPTKNSWNFIKLNTRNGKMKIIQYSINDDKNRFEYSLNETSLVSYEEEVNGRFKLQPTENIFTFILLDQIDGRTWQVQWSFEYNQRFIIPIK